MPGNANIHEDMLWRLQEHFARDGHIDADERALLARQEELCQRMTAVHGLLFMSGGIPRRVRRARPDLLLAITAD